MSPIAQRTGCGPPHKRAMQVAQIAVDGWALAPEQIARDFRIAGAGGIGATDGGVRRIGWHGRSRHAIVAQPSALRLRAYRETSAVRVTLGRRPANAADDVRAEIDVPIPRETRDETHPTERDWRRR
jgi:hypothetical protein